MNLRRGKVGFPAGMGGGSASGFGRDHSELKELVRGVLGIGVCTSSHTHVKFLSSSVFQLTGKDSGSMYSIFTR